MLVFPQIWSVGTPPGYPLGLFSTSPWLTEILFPGTTRWGVLNFSSPCSSSGISCFSKDRDPSGGEGHSSAKTVGSGGPWPLKRRRLQAALMDRGRTRGFVLVCACVPVHCAVSVCHLSIPLSSVYLPKHGIPVPVPRGSFRLPCSYTNSHSTNREKKILILIIPFIDAIG